MRCRSPVTDCKGPIKRPRGSTAASRLDLSEGIHKTEITTFITYIPLRRNRLAVGRFEYFTRHQIILSG